MSRKSQKQELNPKKNVFDTPFEDVEITTKTKIINTNWNIDSKRFFEGCKIKEIMPSNDIKTFYGLNNGDIVYITLEEKHKGRKPFIVKKQSKSFLNSITVIMWVKGKTINESKFVNSKISSSGKFQITGCKKREHAINVAKCIWKVLMRISCESETNIMKLNSTSWENPVAVIRTDLINMDFVVGYKIDRKKVNSYVRSEMPDFISILEISHGYTGVNVKIPAKESEDRVYRVLEWKTPMVPTIQEGGIDDFYSLMREKEVKKHKTKSFGWMLLPLLY